jgi:hypothetical protein
LGVNLLAEKLPPLRMTEVDQKKRYHEWLIDRWN